MTQASRPVGPGDHVFLVDGSSFVFRAYFQSIRQDQKYNYRSDRLPTGAVRLFCTKLLQFIRDGAAGIKPTHLAIIFDKSENSFRKEIYPAYKAHRSEPPDDLVPQFPLMRAAVRAFGLTPIEQDRYEADDLIATYARQARERGADVLIISADKDLMQLDRPGVAMYDPASGEPRGAAHRRRTRSSPISARRREGRRRPGARRRFDRQCARRAGHWRQDRRAIDQRYGDLDTLLAHAGEIKQPKRREALTDPEVVDADPPLEDAADTARLTSSRRLNPSARPSRGRAADRVPQGDGVHHDHSPRRRDLRARPRSDRARRALPRPRRLARARRRDDHAEPRSARRPPGFSGSARQVRRAQPRGNSDAEGSRRRARGARADRTI